MYVCISQELQAGKIYSVQTQWCKKWWFLNCFFTYAVQFLPLAIAELNWFSELLRQLKMGKQESKATNSCVYKNDANFQVMRMILMSTQYTILYTRYRTGTSL